MELIDKNDFRQRMFRAFAMCSDVPANNVYQILMNWLECALQESPTIDAVPVVRCKDCEHWLKNVTGQTGANYSETIANDNGVSTSYTGTLNAYVNKGSEQKKKTISTKETQIPGKYGFHSFLDTKNYEEEVTNDNGVVTKYSGILTKDGDLVSKVVKGSESKTKTISNQPSSYYFEKLANDNGVETFYTGTLTTKTVGKGSEQKTKTVSQDYF